MALIKRRFARISTIGVGVALAAFTLTSSGAATPTTAHIAAKKFVLHEATTLAVPTLDGIISNSVESMQQIYPTLVRITGQGGLAPYMATSWKSNDTGTQWTFTVRKGVKNSDGSPLTAADVAWSFQTDLDTPTSLVRVNIAPFMDAKGSVTASGDTVTFNLKTASATWPRTTTLVPIVSQKAYEKLGAATFASKPIGAGPYQVVGFNPNVRLVLKSNPHFFLGVAPVTYITEDIVADETARLNALKSGEIDVATLSPITAGSAAADKKLKVLTVPSNNVSYLGFNVTNPSLGSPKLREAIGLAINRSAIAKSLYNGVAVPSGQLLAPVTFGYDPLVKPIAYDAAAAKTLVKESGYGGTTLNLNYPTGPLVPGSDQLAQAIQGYLQAIGVNVNLISQDQTTFLNDWFGKRFTGIYLFSFQPSTLDGALVYNLLMHSTQYAVDANAETNFTAQGATPNVKQRLDLLRKIGQSLVGADHWFTPLLVNGRTYAWNPQKVRITPRADGYLWPQYFKRPGSK
jgi:peptide/nickel transport system substrate-binding protein